MNESIAIDPGAQPAADVARGGAAQRRESRLAAAALVALIGLAIGLRLVPILVTPSINWGDEIFQMPEQAHRLVFGYGLVPWEFQLGIRSWLLPGFVAGLMELARPLGDGPDSYLSLIAVTFAAIGAVPVFCCFQWCRRKFGLAGALVGGVTVAIAPELVYFGARTLSEVVAAHLLVLAWYVAEPGHFVESRRRIAAAGALLALVCLLRVQLAPTVAVIALWSVWGLWRTRLGPLLVGGLLVVLLGALFDMATLGSPLASIWRYVLDNAYYGVSSGFSTEPWYYYLLGELGVWGGAAILLIVVIGVGARQMPCLLVAALTTIAVHSGIAHKEYRFIYPAVLLLMVVAGLGLAKLAQIGAQWLRRQGLRRGAVATATLVVVAVWGGVSAKVWSGPAMTSLRFRLHDELAATRFVRGLPGLCGVGLYGKNAWVRYGGYTYLDRPVPIYWPRDEAELTASAPAFDALLYDSAERLPPPARLGFKAQRCFGAICVARRPGGCTARPMSPLPFPAALQRGPGEP